MEGYEKNPVSLGKGMVDVVGLSKEGLSKSCNHGSRVSLTLMAPSFSWKKNDLDINICKC